MHGGGGQRAGMDVSMNSALQGAWLMMCDKGIGGEGRDAEN